MYKQIKNIQIFFKNIFITRKEKRFWHYSFFFKHKEKNKIKFKINKFFRLFSETK